MWEGGLQVLVDLGQSTASAHSKHRHHGTGGSCPPPSTQEGTPGGSSIHLRGLRAQLTLARSCSCTVVFPMSRGVMRCMERKS